MKVLLMRPNCTGNKKDTYITFPLGIGYIAAVLKKEGHEVQILDLTIEDVNYEVVKEIILYFNPDVIGISALSYMYVQVKWLAAYLKKITPSTIILGGHLSNHNYDLVLNKTLVDICVIGEGEITVVDLLQNLNNLSAVKGIAYKTCTQIHKTADREVIEDLDTIPFPAYELFKNLDEYTRLDDVYLSKRHVSKNKVHRKMAIEAGRGCPFSCNFCSRMYQRVRKRSIDNLLAEIKFLNEKYGIDTIWFQDELLFFNKNYIFEFCDRIKDMEIGWYGNARITSVNKEILQKVKDNKCLEIAYGVESGSQEILKNMNKKITQNQILTTLTDTIKIGLPMDMGLILGYPGETEETIAETVRVLGTVGFPGLKFRYITPYPGSLLYKQCIESGKIKDEEEYLISLGDGTGAYRPRINFTQFSDERLRTILKEINDKVFRNYIFYLLKHPVLLLKRIFVRDVMNPVYVIYNRIKRPTNYDKARKFLVE